MIKNFIIIQKKEAYYLPVGFLKKSDKMKNTTIFKKTI